MSIKEKRLGLVFDKELFGLMALSMASVVSLLIRSPLIAILFSLSILLCSIVKMKKYDSMSTWIRCEASLNECKTMKKIYSSRNWNYVYLPDCIYTYSYKDREYKGQSISLYERDSMMQDLNEHYKLMQKIRYTIKKGVYVNPKNPKESVVFRDMAFKSAPIYWSGVIVSVVLMCIGFII